ncbi:hypothetical protein HNR03_006215 [Pseudomonas sp. JAI111]|nr:hypothetical protein [Pseudomonas sp. JAI111]
MDCPPALYTNRLILTPLRMTDAAAIQQLRVTGCHWFDFSRLPMDENCQKQASKTMKISLSRSQETEIRIDQPTINYQP